MGAPTTSGLIWHELMSRDPVVCSPGDHLATAAMKMWHHDCGIVPIVDDATRSVVGVITAMQIMDSDASHSAIGYVIPLQEVAKIWPVAERPQ